MTINSKLIIMALLWAGGFVSARMVSPQAGPFTISFLRFLVASFIIAGIVYQRNIAFSFNKKALMYSVLTGIVGALCYNYFFLSGMKLIDVGRGSVIMSTVPIVVAIISAILFNEKLDALKIIGIALSVVGAWIVITKEQENGIVGQLNLGRGEFYLLCCVLCASVFALLSKQILKELCPLMTLVYTSVCGTVMLAIPAVMEMNHAPRIVLTFSFIANVLYLAIGPSVIAVIFYYEGINAVGPSRASQYMNLMPVFAVTMAILFLGEPITLSLFIGGAFVTAGLYLNHRKTI